MNESYANQSTHPVTPLYEVKGWVKLMGIISIIGGAMQCLTCVGIIVGWLPIWMGVCLLRSAEAAERAYASNDDMALRESLARLATYFKINGVLVLIGIVIAVLGIVLAIMVPAFAAVFVQATRSAR